MLSILSANMVIWTPEMHSAWHGVHTHDVKHETQPGQEKIHGFIFLSGIYLEDT